MKKFMVALISMVLMISLTACGGSKNTNPDLIGDWNMYDTSGNVIVEFTFTDKQMSMGGTVKRYEVSDDGLSLIVFDSDDDKEGRSTQFMVDGDILKIEGDTLYRVGSESESEFLDSLENAA